MSATVDPWNVRSKLNLSAEVLARIIGVMPSTLDRWDHRQQGLSKANIETLSMISAAGDAARDPQKLGRAMARALFKHGRQAALYLALHTLYWRVAPGREG